MYVTSWRKLPDRPRNVWLSNIQECRRYLFIYLFIYLIRQMAPLSTLRRSEIAGITERRQTVVKVRDRGLSPLLRFEPPAIV